MAAWRHRAPTRLVPCRMHRPAPGGSSLCALLAWPWRQRVVVTTPGRRGDTAGAAYLHAGTTAGRAPTGTRPARPSGAPTVYSCAGSGSMVRASTGTCTSSRHGVVIMNTRITGKAFMNDR